MRYFFILALALVSCEKSEPFINPIEGEWVIKFCKQYGKTYPQRGDVSFRNGGTFAFDSTSGTYDINVNGIHLNNSNCYFNYTISGDTLIVDYLFDKSSVYGSCIYSGLDVKTYLLRRSADRF